MTPGKLKPGRRHKLKNGTYAPPANEYAQEYERYGIKAGITVEEWEKSHNLPPYTLYPYLIDQATNYKEKGYFMYRSATPEERELMERKGLRKRRNCIDTRG